MVNVTFSCEKVTKEQSRVGISISPLLTITPLKTTNIGGRGPLLDAPPESVPPVHTIHRAWCPRGLLRGRRCGQEVRTVLRNTVSDQRGRRRVSTGFARRVQKGALVGE